MRSRARISALLDALNAARRPRILLTLRAHDGVPNWITHVVQLGPDSQVSYLGERSKWTPLPSQSASSTVTKDCRPLPSREGRPEVLRLDGVNITGRRPILINVKWSVYAGERWALKGHNGEVSFRAVSYI